MSYKRFSSKDLIYNVIKTNPKSTFSVKEGIVYYQFEKSETGDFSNKVKHIPSGHISLHEANINRPSDSLIYSYLVRSSDNEALPPISSSAELNEIDYGTEMTSSYPMSSSISRIYIPSGPDGATYDENNTIPDASHVNKKYIRSLRNTLEAQGNVSSAVGYGTLGSDIVNMICVPGIFCGSRIQPGSIELEYFVNNSRIGKVQDKFSDGRLMEVISSTPPTYNQVGTVIYDQGLMLLTSSEAITNHTENYESEGATTNPKWTNFGTGIPQLGTAIEHGPCPATSYKIKFNGENKIPTLTMFAYSDLADNNYSHNPTFLTSSRSETIRHNSSSFYQEELDIKKINKSEYQDAIEDFNNVTYISKIGIYDRFKNLIAIASLSRPIKKTEKRDYMFKIGIDF